MRPVPVGGNLTASIVRARSGCVITLAGTIDETLDGARLRAEARGIVILDLDGVRRITSFGVREWMRLVGTLDVTYLAFVRCRPAIVAQLNMVAKFSGRGQVVSLYVPYVCKQHHEFDVLFDLRRDHAALASFELPEARCPTCHEEGELDDVPETYLAYVASTPAPKPPAAAETLIEGRGTAPPLTPFRIDKEVAGNLTALWLSGTLDKATRLRRLVEGLEGDVLAVAEDLSATAEGLSAFLTEAAHPGVRLYLARARLEVLAALGECTQARVARVVSARIRYECGHCAQEVLIDVDEATRRRFLGDRPLGPPCETCGERLRADAGEDAIRLALAAPFEVAPRSVRVYLDEAESRHADTEIARVPAAATADLGSVQDKYRLIRSLGTGGMAEIFLARQMGPEGFDRVVALKRIHPHLAKNELFVDMLLQEARIAACLSHPNIVAIHSVAKLDGHYYIAMEYVRGCDLATILQLAGGALPANLAIRVVADICAGLSAAHGYVDDNGRALPVVHRDVSPSNVLVSLKGIVKLTDFGIAKVGDSVMAITETGTVKGKIAYTAPERLDMTSTVAADTRQDLFAAGVVLHECLTGEPLFQRSTRIATLRAVAYDPIPRVSQLRGDVPPELDAILARALERDPARRYPTALAFQSDLEAAVVDHPALAAKTSDLGAWVSELLRRSGAAAGLRLATESIPPRPDTEVTTEPPARDD